MEANTSLRIFGFCGLIGILVDLDHAVSLFLWEYTNLQVTSGRIWHSPLFIVSCCFTCYLVSYLGGFYTKLVLGGIIIATILVLLLAPWVTWGLNG